MGNCFGDNTSNQESTPYNDTKVIKIVVEDVVPPCYIFDNVINSVIMSYLYTDFFDEKSYVLPYYDSVSIRSYTPSVFYAFTRSYGGIWELKSDREISNIEVLFNWLVRLYHGNIRVIIFTQFIIIRRGAKFKIYRTSDLLTYQLLNDLYENIGHINSSELIDTIIKIYFVDRSWSQNNILKDIVDSSRQELWQTLFSKLNTISMIKWCYILTINNEYQININLDNLFMHLFRLHFGNKVFFIHLLEIKNMINNTRDRIENKTGCDYELDDTIDNNDMIVYQALKELKLDSLIVDFKEKEFTCHKIRRRSKSSDTSGSDGYSSGEYRSKIRRKIKRLEKKSKKFSRDDRNEIKRKIKRLRKKL